MKYKNTHDLILTEVVSHNYLSLRAHKRFGFKTLHFYKTRKPSSFYAVFKNLILYLNIKINLTLNTNKKMKKTRLLFVALLGFISLSMQAQQVSGIVLDEDDNPIPGVNVIVEGTANGTTTDFDGNFSIVADEGESLVFSFIGYANPDFEAVVANKC